MPHIAKSLSKPKINLDKISAELLTYAEILVREYAEQKNNRYYRPIKTAMPSS